MKKLIIAIKALILKAINRILYNDIYMAYHGDDFYFVLWDLDQDYLRQNIRNNPRNLSNKQIDILQEARDKLYELMEEHGVDFDRVE